MSGGGAPYAALQQWLKAQTSRGASTANPFTPGYFASQADEVEALLSKPRPAGVRILDYGCGSGSMLSTLRARGVPADDLHCIEVSNMVPEGQSGTFVLHVLGDPVLELGALAAGELRASFDAISVFVVLHHIERTDVRVVLWPSLLSMLKPGGVLLVSDWDGQEWAKEWYDVAHVLLWVLMGSAPPEGDTTLSLGTRYDSVDQYVAAAVAAGLVDQASLSTPAKEVARDALGGFNRIFLRPSGEGQTYLASKLQSLNASRSNDTNMERLGI